MRSGTRQDKNGTSLSSCPPLNLHVLSFHLAAFTDGVWCNRYASLAPLYYRGAAAAVVVYDITNTESFSKAQFWVKELQKHGNPDMVVALVGNKADLEHQREVSREVNNIRG